MPSSHARASSSPNTRSAILARSSRAVAEPRRRRAGRRPASRSSSPSSSSCTTASVESVAAPSSPEQAQRLRLAGAEPAGQPHERGHWLLLGLARAGASSAGGLLLGGSVFGRGLLAAALGGLRSRRGRLLGTGASASGSSAQAPRLLGASAAGASAAGASAAGASAAGSSAGARSALAVGLGRLAPAAAAPPRRSRSAEVRHGGAQVVDAAHLRAGEHVLGQAEVRHVADLLADARRRQRRRRRRS